MTGHGLVAIMMVKVKAASPHDNGDVRRQFRA
jgi:hypothetical protein